MKATLLIAAAVVAAGWAAPVSGTTIIYNNFDSTSGLQVNGDAAQVYDGTRNVLRLTPGDFFQAGSAFGTNAIALTDSYSFSTRFTFNINQPMHGGADGIVFVVQTNNNTFGGAGGGIGYLGIPNSLGIEFDTWDNTGDGVDDRNSNNHVGINTGGSIDSHVVAYPPFVLEFGLDFTSWIDYNSTTQLLEVRMSNSMVRPLTPLLSYTVDLNSVLGGGPSGTSAFVGFTSGTGGAFANHDIINWEFRDNFAPVGGVVPEPTTWALVILGFGMIGAAMRRRPRARLLPS